MSIRRTATRNGFGRQHGALRYLASTQTPIKIAYFYQGGSLIALRAFYNTAGSRAGRRRLPGTAPRPAPAPSPRSPEGGAGGTRAGRGRRAEGAQPAARRRPATGRAERPAPPARARGGRLHSPTWRATHLLLPSHQSAPRGRGAAAFPSQ